MSPLIHTVRDRENLSVIAAKYRVNWRDIGRANDGRTVRIGSGTYTFRNAPPFTIWPGLRLTIPGRTVPTPAPSPNPSLPGGGAIREPEPPVIRLDPVFPPVPVISDDTSKSVLYGGLAVAGLGIAYLFYRMNQPKKRARRP